MSALVLVLRTPNRPEFDAACSLLKHQGIAFHVRETQEIISYVPLADLLLYVQAADREKATELFGALREEAHSAELPYRASAFSDLDSDQDLAPEAEADDRQRSPWVRKTALVIAALWIIPLALAAVAIAATFLRSLF